MNNLVCTLEEQANLVGEIELTDAQLAAVFGAHDNCHCHHKSDDSNISEKKKSCNSKHVSFSKTIHEHFEFSFDLSINFEDDEDEDENNLISDDSSC